MVYKYSTQYFPIPAQVAGEELEKIEAKYGELTNENVLKAARAKSSKLHPCFEWDDKIAAEKYRLHKAGQLIRSVTVVIEEAESKEVRAFVNISDEPTGRYINIQAALSEEDTKAVVLARAYAELRAFQKKYQDLTELSAVFKAIADVLPVA